MTVEAGARGAYMAPSEKVCAYLKDKPRALKGELRKQAVSVWKALKSDDQAVFDQEIRIKRVVVTSIERV